MPAAVVSALRDCCLEMLLLLPRVDLDSAGEEEEEGKAN